MTEFLELVSVTKRYGTYKALDDISLNVGRGEFVTLLGPSGSGKSTALMVIAGFVAPNSGRVLFDGRDITHLKPEQRGFGIVFQGYALFPHMTVADNIAYPLRVRRKSKAEIAELVKRALDLVQLSAFAERKPAMLSGGQQQRVAIARALVYEPPVLLLDEPLSALDKKLRAELQDGLKDLHQRLGMTFVNVTHDQDEALGLSTSVVVLAEGRVMQQSSPDEVYDRPNTAFVADFVGGANLIRLRETTSRDGLAQGSVAGQQIVFRPRFPLGGGRAVVAVRPEKIQVGAMSGAGWNSVVGHIAGHERIGPHTRWKIQVEGHGVIRATGQAGETRRFGYCDQATISWPETDSIHVFDDSGMA